MTLEKMIAEAIATADANHAEDARYITVTSRDVAVSLEKVDGAWVEKQRYEPGYHQKATWAIADRWFATLARNA